MSLWNYLKSFLIDNGNQLISENDADMTFEEATIWAENSNGQPQKLNLNNRKLIPRLPISRSPNP